MSMRNAALSAIVGCLALLGGQAAWGQGTIYVATSGSDKGSGEDLDPARTINVGVAMAQADANIMVRIAPGVYDEGVEVRKGTGKLTLHGDHDEKEPKAERHTVVRAAVYVDRRPAGLENLVLRGAKDATEALVRLSNAQEATLTNCVISSGGPALAISRCAKVRIENCTLIGGGSAVSLVGCGEVAITGCTITSSQGLGSQYGYVAKRDAVRSFYALSASECASLALKGCAVQAPQRVGNALWLDGIGKFEADGNRYWGTFATGLGGPRTARTIEDWRELSGQDAGSRLVRLEYVADLLYGCRPDPRSVWGGEDELAVPVPRNSIVSIGIFNAKGAQVRTLVNEYETRDQAELKLHWDGSDNLRIPASPGDYSLKVFRCECTVRQSWIGNSGGGDDFVQPEIADLCLVPPGDFLATNSAFGEAAKQAGAYSVGGKVLHSFPGLNRWGCSGGEAVAATGEFVFVACRQAYAEDAGDRSPPKGEAWYCVRRYRPDGTFAPWAQGQGWNRTLRVLDKAPCVAGLAAQGRRLYVSDSRAKAVRVFDTETMDEVRRFPFERPGRLAAEASGAVWIASPGAEDQYGCAVRCDAAGKPGARIEKLESPVALCLDEARGRLLIADNGPRQILIYDIKSDPPKPAGALGVPDGIYADPPGQAGDLRFNRLTGVATDAEGNVYVATSGVETSPVGAEIRKISPRGTLVWRLGGLAGVDGVAIDPETPEDVYTPRQRFRVDYAKEPPAWELAAWTLRPGKYDDPREHGRYASVAFRRLAGKPLLFAADKAVTRVAFFRFAGDIAVPGGLFIPACKPREWPIDQPDQGRWFWCDANGDGKIQPAETSRMPVEEAHSWDCFVDSEGGLWRAPGRNQLLRYPCRGPNRNGNPVYQFEDLKGFPIPRVISEVQEFDVQPDPLTLHLAGGNKEFQREPGEGAGPGACLIARYLSHGEVRWLFPIDTGAAACSFSVAGDLVFVTDALKAAIQVYDAATGLRVGTAGPGRLVGYQSGGCDFPRGLAAYRRPDGEVLVFNPDAWKARVMLYRVRGGLREFGSQPVTTKKETPTPPDPPKKETRIPMR